MTFNINELKGRFNKINGYSSPSKFLVLITPPPWAVGEQSSDTIDVLPYIINSTNLPGMSFTFSDIRQIGYGPIERRPDVPIYTEVPMTIYSTGDGRAFRFFHRWMQNVINVGLTNVADNQSSKGAYQFESYYSDNYLSTIDIIHYNETEDEIIRYTLNDAYPTTIADTAVSWATTDQILELNVSFTFRTWYSTAFSPASITNNPRDGGGSLSFLQALGTFGTIASTLSNLQRPTNIQDALNTINTISTTGRQASQLVGSLF